MKTSRDPPKSKGLTVLRIVRRVFIYLFAVGIIIAALLFASSRTPDKSLFGYRYYTVLTPSMEPEYGVGDMVFVKIEKADKIKVGDVITFNPSSDSEAYLTHRVVEKLENYEGTGVTCFRTKGDANDSEDQFLIDEGRLIGRVSFSIPKLGYVVRFVQMRWYFVVPLIVLVFVFFKLMGMYLAPHEEESEAEGEKEESSEEQSEPEPEPKEPDLGEGKNLTDNKL
ncbi:MAG: signal peptidase I [Ruminococcus sp.]|nr:signal peptidase I [Ruminococcus sp.]MBR2305393.1 signal peptidase I [Ruminococcus sp.]